MICLCCNVVVAVIIYPLFSVLHYDVAVLRNHDYPALVISKR